MALTFVTLVLIQFFNAYNCRSDRLSVFRRPFANRWLNIAVGVGSWCCSIAILYVPFFQRAFGTFSLSRADWMLVLALGVLDCAGAGGREVDGVAAAGSVT